MVSDVLPKCDNTLLNDDNFFRFLPSLISEAIDELKEDSTAGTSYMAQGFATIESVVSDPFERDALASLSLDRLTKWATTSTEQWTDIFNNNLFDAIDENYIGIMRPFQKGEPHPARKVQEGRFRIVMGGCLVTQVCERVIFKNFSKALKNHFLSPGNPSALGIGFTDEQAAALYQFIQEEFPEAFQSSDVIGWDTKVGPFMIRCAARISVLLGGSGSKFSFLGTATRSWAETTLRGVFAAKAENGKVYIYVAKAFGRMPSGSYVTAGINTTMRVLLAGLNGAWRLLAAGDDALEAFLSAISQCRLEKRSIVDHQRGGSFSFCSHTFTLRDGENGKYVSCSLDTWQKSLFGMLPKLSLERINAIFYETRHNDRLEQIQICEAILLQLSVQTLDI